MIKISDMPDGLRRFIRRLIKVHCKKNDVYKEANKHGIGLEQTEETVEKLLDNRDLTIESDNNKDNPGFTIKPGI